MELASKVCTKCGTDKPFVEYVKAKRGKFGLAPKCKSCEKQWREDNKDAIKIAKRKRYEDNREVILAQMKQYRIDNKEKVTIRKRREYIKNRDRYLERSRQYRVDHGDKKALSDKKYYADNIEKIKKYRSDNAKELSDKYKVYYSKNKVEISKRGKARTIKKREGMLPALSRAWVEEAKTIHANIYDYSTSVYSKARKISICCEAHGLFYLTANRHLSGEGCPVCKKEAYVNPAVYTSEQFIEKSKAVHGDKFSYGNVNYVNNRTKIAITCSLHGDFMQVPGKNLAGSGCPRCAKSGFKTNIKGFLYILHNTPKNIFKIGITNDPKTRMATLIRCTPFSFEVLYSFEMLGAYARVLESYAHEKCMSAKLKGFDGATEWFKFDQKIIDELKLIKEYM